MAETHGVTIAIQYDDYVGKPVNWDEVVGLWKEHKATGKQGDNFKDTLYKKGGE